VYSKYYTDIITAIEKNIVMNDLFDKTLADISTELQNHLNNNITTFHHTISDCIKVEEIKNNITLQICDHMYTIDKTTVLKKYSEICAKANCSSENTMKDCLLKELLHVVTNFYYML
jgi:hypothetical protein